MEKITLKLLEEVEPGDILASGEFKDEWLCNICDTGNTLKWVAVRGGIPDWTIYFENIWSNETVFYPNLGEWTLEDIKRRWDKLPKSMARELLEVSDWALAMYRT